jgi:hypothetical protein
VAEEVGVILRETSLLGSSLLLGEDRFGLLCVLERLVSEDTGVRFWGSLAGNEYEEGVVGREDIGNEKGDLFSATGDSGGVGGRSGKRSVSNDSRSNHVWAASYFPASNAVYGKGVSISIVISGEGNMNQHPH